MKILEGAIPSPGRALEYEQGAPSPVICKIAITDGLPAKDSMSPMGQPEVPIPTFSAKSRLYHGNHLIQPDDTDSWHCCACEHRGNLAARRIVLDAWQAGYRKSQPAIHEGDSFPLCRGLERDKIDRSA